MDEACIDETDVSDHDPEIKHVMSRAMTIIAIMMMTTKMAAMLMLRILTLTKP